MKRSCLLILLVLVLMLSACGGKPVEETQPETTIPETAATEETEAVDYSAPDFTMYDLDGNPVNLSDFFGKPIVLNFWASWCGPCKSEMPDLEEAYLEYGEDIHFLIVNLTDGSSETVETASAYIESQGYTFPVYYDTDMDGAYAYSISSIPMTFFIDANGDLYTYYLGAMSADILQQGIDMIYPAAE